MLKAFIVSTCLGLAIAVPVKHSKPSRSFLATAFRAARSGSSNQAKLWVWHSEANPAPAPVPAAVPAPPPPPPDPLPPDFPVIGQDQCELLAEAFVVDPPATCKHTIYAENSDGCTCTMVLPASINPQPANFYNPFLVDIPANPDIPMPKAMPTVPPPSNPLQPFIAPMMPPECPFIAACADPDGFDCVGHNSWGFAEAHMADYSPAAGALNTVSCSYLMKPYALFKVPERVKALWHLNAKLVKVFDRTAAAFSIACHRKNVTSPSLEHFCRDKLNRLGLPCDTEWKTVTNEHEAQECKNAPAPDGFDVTSSLAELCPLECGWKKGVTRWPPFLTAKEKAAKARKEKKEKKEKDDLAAEPKDEQTEED